MSKLIFLPTAVTPLQSMTAGLSGGIKGNYQTIEVMSQIAWNRMRIPEVRNRALSVIQTCASHDRICEALSIGDFVKNTVRYVKDPLGVELLTDPLTMLSWIDQGTAQGDCDDMALLIATLCLAVGIRPKFRMARYEGKSGPFQHIYVVVYDANANNVRRRVVLDAILKDQPIGSEVPQESGEERSV